MTLLVQDRDKAPGVLLLTLNRPERHNALGRPLLMELDQTLQQIASDEGVRCVVITGAGDRAFSAGADINEQTGFTPEHAYAHMRWGQDIFSRLERLAKPTIAAINGFALGGGLELALACDLRTASEAAQLGLPEVTLASLPGWGGTQRLPRLIGASQAKMIAMSGQRVQAERCLQLGLVNAVYPHAEHLTKTLDLAAQIASHTLDSLQAIKQVIDDGLVGSLAGGMEAEARAVARLWGTPAQKQAQKEFFSRRTGKAATSAS
ncbi:enoyl-CoA hydratase/isomerase family protein [Limobrevibacterium gyesilva]|uniref:Enoyl-CoA hydratase/isomerase family protein n=1 Tax=Limobrevibacterium gyesilva TaxID=2991712 RepID=A0AA41YIS5_9PROT|nr:enoyl-CoA hydratase/isomerase family protein [Limobrevibacterium gyesilva]MCW3473235.1 enoyl-CoA hydratase/isomerase family protein [Limobrevibacterium gyesilva]